MDSALQYWIVLADWPVEWFRLFVGDVSNDVNERTLDSAFDKYPSYCKCKVVRDRLSEKVRRWFLHGEDFAVYEDKYR